MKECTVTMSMAEYDRLRAVEKELIELRQKGPEINITLSYKDVTGYTCSDTVYRIYASNLDSSNLDEEVLSKLDEYVKRNDAIRSEIIKAATEVKQANNKLSYDTANYNNRVIAFENEKTYLLSLKEKVKSLRWRFSFLLTGKL